MKSLLRAAGFAAGLAILLYIANTFFVTTDTLSYLTLDELTHRDDAQIVFVGSSIARNHFIPEIVQEETGLVPFNLALPYMAMQGSIAASKLMFKHHDPQWMVLVAEPYLFEATRESPQTQFRLMPFLHHPIDRLSYYWDLCTQDERWLDRLLLPREYGVTSLEDLAKTLRHHLDAAYYYDAQAQTAETVSIGSTYQGSGYMHPDFNIPEAQRLRIGAGRSMGSSVSALPEYSKEAILRFVRLCEANGAKPMVIIFPYITAAMLSTPDYLTYNQLLEAFCAENSIPCFNFAMAKESLMPPLDAYYQNVEHMSIDGAQLLTQAFCEVFSRYTAGEDVSSLFYQSTEEYLASIDRVTNVWFEASEDGAYAAACNHGSAVTPEYAFVAIAADGSQTLLRDYAADPVFSGEIPDGCTLRVYARAQENDSPAVYYDLR